ncbi:hypothetical protein V2J09_007785 [Rumex salicifolius]
MVQRNPFPPLFYAPFFIAFFKIFTVLFLKLMDFIISRQEISSYIKHSPEVTSKPTVNEEQNEQTKSLTEKLSAAQLTIAANEELVKQHAKVAEEAVTGWEKAEREASTLRSQLDATVKKNSALEERVSHLDGALKECVRQLRQAREEQERKIEEIIAKRTHQWESRKSELESQVIELSSQLEAAKSEAASLRPKMDKTEKENKSLMHEIGVLSKKLEVSTIERDFSTKTAESASKQHLDSIRKLAKVTGMDDFLEMEKLAALPVKGDGKVERTIKRISELEDKIVKLEEEKGKLEMALTESQAHLNDQLKVSDEQLKATKAELKKVQDQFRTSQANLNAVENDLIELQTQLIEREDQLNASKTELMELQNQLIERENMLNSSQVQLKDAENNLVELQMQLTERDIKIKASQGHANDTEARLIEVKTQSRDCQDKLKASEEQLKDANNTLADLHAQLDLTAKIKQSVERELEASNVERAKAELKVKALESETSSMLARISSLVDEVENKRALTAELMAKCQSLEDELSKKTPEIDPRLQPPICFKAEKKAEQEKGFAIAAGKLADCQRTIASLGKQLKSLATIDNFLLDSENPMDFSKDSSVLFRTSDSGKLPCIDCQ